MTEIARLRVQLDEIRPPIRRRVEVPLTTRLDDLHLVMQAVMGWENYHLYEFRISRDIAYGPPSPDGGFSDTEVLSAKRTTLARLLECLPGKTKSFKYTYDFGDDWQHTVKVEAITEADPDINYPRLVSAERACPPEDVGGPWGYAEYVEAISDPSHERHAEMVEWRGDGFDPAVVDEDQIRSTLKLLARKVEKRAKTSAVPANKPAA
jgi:hypothetical protein